MPASLFLRAKKEWTCRSCGQVILSRERYYRKRLAPLCLGCMPRDEQDGDGEKDSTTRDAGG